MRKELVLVLVTMAVTAIASWAGRQAWETFGWTTPEQHADDVQSALSAVQALSEHVTHNEEKLDRNYWTRLCDEWGEDLADWLEEPNPSAMRLEQIRQKQEAISENDCYKYAE